MFIDLGEKSGPCEPSKVTEDTKVRTYYPSLYLKMDTLPEMKLGEEVEVKVKIRVKGLREAMEGGKHNVDVDVLAIDFGKEGKKTAGQKLSDMVEEETEEMNRK